MAYPTPTGLEPSRYANPNVPSGSGSSSSILGSTVRRYTGTRGLGRSPADDEQEYAYGTQGYEDRRNRAYNEARRLANEAVRGKLTAIDQTYAQMTKDRMTVNANNLGRTRATTARSGTLGSDFGNADMANQESRNAEALKIIENEKLSKIAAIMNDVAVDTESRAQAELDRIDANSEDRINFLKDLSTKAEAQIAAFAAAGGNIEDLSDDEYNSLLENSGLTPEQFKAKVVLNQPKQDVLYSEVVGNKYIQARRNPMTGKVTSDTIELGFTVPQGYKVQKNDDGSLMFMPDKIDPTKPLGSQVLYYNPTGAGGGKGKTKKSGNLSYSDQDVSSGVKTLNSVRGTDNFVYTPTYIDMLKNWQEGGGRAEDFFKEFDPRIYLNPNDPTIPAYIKAKLPKTTTTAGRSV